MTAADRFGTTCNCNCAEVSSRPEEWGIGPGREGDIWDFPSGYQLPAKLSNADKKLVRKHAEKERKNRVAYRLWAEANPREFETIHELIQDDDKLRQYNGY